MALVDIIINNDSEKSVKRIKHFEKEEKIVVISSFFLGFSYFV